MEQAIAVGLAVAWVLLGISGYQSWRLYRDVAHYPEARLVFISQNTLKLWVFLFTGLSVLNAVVGLERMTVRILNYLLVGSLILQAGWSSWAYHRWRSVRPPMFNRALIFPVMIVGTMVIAFVLSMLWIVFGKRN